MGLGTFGGGVGVAKFLADRGARVTVTDLKNEPDLSDSVKKLKNLGIRFVLGRHEMDDFTAADFVVVSPAVPRNSEYILAARSAGIILRTEIGLFVERCPAAVCGITGSNGKTTTVSMIQSILKNAHTSHWIGGNIGGSLLSDLRSISPEDRVVLELSSFQLEWLNEISWSPKIAAVLNIMPNHLDRHGTLDNYTTAKGYILDHQKNDDIAVLVRDDPGSCSLSSRVRGNVTWVGTDLDIPGIMLDGRTIADRSEGTITKILDICRLKVPGKHMVINAMVAAACAREMGIDTTAIAEGLASYHGLPHRLEPLGEYNGIAFYNDSKATTPEAAAAGVTAFENKTIIPIFGGYDKKVSFDEMAQRIAGHVHWAALIGETAPLLSQALEKAGIASSTYTSLDEAFEACVMRASDGDIVLLSPGCASYDMFNNFEERGEVFRMLVAEYNKK